ncbi:hypothetical protein JM93_04304 [Roseibium hamelinense]|uniref:Lipoprotein n=1 Tax=Roseibium hamelinense TaxID=150831 RepID=A0A562SEQ5_9HYPH|nr:hypothetical protein [Roseibium hamelinense]MTI42589.1 hypothetical protein [Roseibium hamelinense]TWI79533.1 hypothetical protein JM93_04304 [Roseibium hamelinense]
MRFGPALVCSFVVSACVGGSQNPRLESVYVGQPSSDFFLKYGPPAQVIGFEPVPPGTDPITVTQNDPKELVYYWSSNNRKTDFVKGLEAPEKSCDLAILTKADGKILRIEVQTTSGSVQDARAYCQSIIE